jgi:hypothetical protein
MKAKIITTGLAPQTRPEVLSIADARLLLQEGIDPVTALRALRRVAIKDVPDFYRTLPTPLYQIVDVWKIPVPFWFKAQHAEERKKEQAYRDTHVPNCV